MRKMIHALLNVNAAKSYVRSPPHLHAVLTPPKVPYQDLENKQMLNDLLDSPETLLEHLRRYSSSLVASIVYG